MLTINLCAIEQLMYDSHCIEMRFCTVQGTMESNQSLIVVVLLTSVCTGLLNSSSPLDLPIAGL